MTEENNKWEFKVEDIFEDIPDDPENILMNIPPAVMEAVGLKPGDPIRVSVGDQGTLIIEKITQEEYESKTKE